MISTRKNLAAIAIPCCVPQTIGSLTPDVEYEDPGIWSPKRKVLVWKHILK